MAKVEFPVSIKQRALTPAMRHVPRGEVALVSSGIPAGGGPSTVVCQTVTRLVRLDLSQSTSPVGNTPLSFITTSRNISSAVLNPTSSMPDVQLSELFGDYFFDVIVTDSKGNVGRGVVDIQYVRTTVR